MDQFRALLREHLRERGALARLSENSGIASHVIGRWRDGVGRPTDTNLKRLAPHLGVSYEELMRLCGYLPSEVNDAQVELAQARHENQQLKSVLKEVRQLLSSLTTSSPLRVGVV